MQLSHRQIIKLPVETRSGQKLGVVVSFELDSERQSILRYVVKPAMVPRLLANELIISATQVISLTNEKMLVDDAVLPQREAEPSPVV